MTNKDALLAVLQDVSVPALSLDKVLLDGNITGTDAYTSENAKAIDLCAIELLYGIFTSPDVMEGGYSKSNPDIYRKLQARLLYLAKKHDVTDILNQMNPTVKGVSPW